MHTAKCSYFLWVIITDLHQLWHMKIPSPQNVWAERGSQGEKSLTSIPVFKFLGRILLEPDLLIHFSAPPSIPISHKCSAEFLHLNFYFLDFYMWIFKMSLVLFPSFPMFYASSVPPVPTTRLPLQETLKQVLSKHSTPLVGLLKESGTSPSPYSPVSEFPASLYPDACMFSYNAISHHSYTFSI